jgi:hypothetical protein
MKKIDVVRSSELKAGYSTPRIVREKAFESMHRYIIVSRTRVAGGAVSDWHHHGTRDLYFSKPGICGWNTVRKGPALSRFDKEISSIFLHVWSIAT